MDHSLGGALRRGRRRHRRSITEPIVAECPPGLAESVVERSRAFVEPDPIDGHTLTVDAEPEQRDPLDVEPVEREPGAVDPERVVAEQREPEHVVAKQREPQLQPEP
ncbi:MAG: hypothetical protein AAF602_14970 [Myxococcota bacterium]